MTVQEQKKRDKEKKKIEKESKGRRTMKHEEARRADMLPKQIWCPKEGCGMLQ
jgi:hypothetical protein